MTKLRACSTINTVSSYQAFKLKFQKKVWSITGKSYKVVMELEKYDGSDPNLNLNL